jgi:hypothetical protein
MTDSRFEALKQWSEEHPQNPVGECLSSIAGLNQEAGILRDKVDRLEKLNEDKYRTIQAYCRAASEDKAEIEKLKRTLAALDPGPLVSALQKELGLLRMVVLRLPKTKDGKPIYPGTRLWNAFGSGIVNELPETTGATIGKDGSLDAVYFQGGFTVAICPVFSTEEAAKAWNVEDGR